VVRLKPKPGQRGRQDNWLLIKGHDGQEREGVDAEALEAAIALPKKQRRASTNAPIAGAVRGPLPDRQPPQLAAVAETAPQGPGWLTEIKFDGYRILASVDHGKVRLLTRNGNDWTDRSTRRRKGDRAASRRSRDGRR